MLPLLPVPVCRLCSHFRPRSRALLARMTFRTRWCATTTLTARTAVTRASVTSHPVTCSHTLTVATERYGVRFFPLGFCQFACLPVYSLVFLGLCQSVRSSACMPIVRLRVQLSVRLLVCMSASPSMSVLACFPVYSQSAFLCVSWWSPCLSPWLSHFLFLCLFGCLLICLLVCRSACIFLCLLGGNLVCLHVSLVIHLVCLQVLLAVCLSLFVSIWWSPRLSLCLFGGLLVCLRVSLAICLSVFVSTRWSPCPSSWWSVCLSSCILGGLLVHTVFCPRDSIYVSPRLTCTSVSSLHVCLLLSLSHACLSPMHAFRRTCSSVLLSFCSSRERAWRRRFGVSEKGGGRGGYVKT